MTGRAPKAVTLKQAAELGVRDVSTLYRWQRAGLIKPFAGDLFMLDALQAVARTKRRGRPPATRRGENSP